MDNPVCLFHGKRWDENPPHWAGRCMYCCLCFRVFNNLEEMHLTHDDLREYICQECWLEEELLTIAGEK